MVVSVIPIRVERHSAELQNHWDRIVQPLTVERLMPAAIQFDSFFWLSLDLIVNCIVLASLVLIGQIQNDSIQKVIFQSKAGFENIISNSLTPKAVLLRWCKSSKT